MYQEVTDSLALGDRGQPNDVGFERTNYQAIDRSTEQVKLQTGNLIPSDWLHCIDNGDIS